MKIVEINANWGRGGPGGVVKDLYSVFQSKGENCLFCYGRGNVPEGINGYRIGSLIGNVTHLLKSRFLDSAGFESKYATQILCRKISEYGPDVVHLHNLLGYYLDVDVLFSFLKASDLPVIWTLHDCWAFTGHCINYEQAGCLKWEKGCFECPLKSDYPECIYSDRSERNFARKKQLFTEISNLTLVTPSKWLKSSVERSFLSEYDVNVIPNGIDISCFNRTENDIRQKYSLENKTVLLAVAGVWNRMKGLYLLNDIAEKLDSQYKVVLIGDTGKNTVAEKIIHLKRTENVAELVKWYSAADMLVNPTFGDNFPTVNIEALCCGLPVVTNATGGSPEAAGNEAGRIVYSKTAEEFILRIKECESEHYEPAYIRSYGVKYDRIICGNKYHELIESIVEKR